jgi:hypothetical protein
MGVDNALSQLQERRLLLVGPDPAGSRYKVAQLTPLGGQAQQQYEPAVAARERLWVSAYSTETVQALRAVLEALVGEPTAAHSPLFSALVPCSDGWRAAVPAPTMLPHYPVVSHRGG